MSRSDMDFENLLNGLSDHFVQPSNVVALRGADLPLADGEADPEVVAVLERWLADAKAGHLVGVALAGCRSDHARCTAWAMSARSENDTSAAVLALHHRVGTFLVGQEVVE